VFGPVRSGTVPGLSTRRTPASSRVRLAAALTAGVLIGTAVGVWGSAVLSPLVGWDTAAIVYVTWSWVTEWKLDARATAAHAGREDPGRATTDVLLLVASVASLGADAAVIANASSNTTRLVAGVVGLASVVLSWTLVHTIYTARYARLYYAKADGVDFNEEEPPRYSDFAYVAFTVGMTYQVSDTDLTDKTIRAVVLRHALLSYGLGAVILAATINLVAGLAK
jgi:uncharacterized membrane protein